MSQDEYREKQAQPIVITDKRQQRREEARARAEAAQHPSVTPAEAGQLSDMELAIERIERIQHLQEEGRRGELTPEQQAELLALQAEEDAAREKEAASGNAVSALTAFLVIVGHDGSATATHDVNTVLDLEREPTVDDMYSACSLVLRDINAALAGKHTVFGLQVSAQAMTEKMQAARLMRNANGLDLGAHRR